MIFIRQIVSQGVQVLSLIQLAGTAERLAVLMCKGLWCGLGECLKGWACFSGAIAAGSELDDAEGRIGDVTFTVEVVDAFARGALEGRDAGGFVMWRSSTAEVTVDSAEGEHDGGGVAASIRCVIYIIVRD